MDLSNSIKGTPDLGTLNSNNTNEKPVIRVLKGEEVKTIVATFNYLFTEGKLGDYYVNIDQDLLFRMIGSNDFREIPLKNIGIIPIPDINTYCRLYGEVLMMYFPLTLGFEYKGKKIEELDNDNEKIYMEIVTKSLPITSIMFNVQKNKVLLYTDK